MDTVKANKAGIARAVAVLRRGGVIAYPTDTAYGLGGVFNSAAVVKKILRIKNRRDRKFTIVAASRQQVKRFFKLGPLEKKLARWYWPGPLSIVVSKRFAVRVSAHRVTRELCRRVGKPLIATSANLTGHAVNYSVGIIAKQLKHKRSKPDLILDAGKLVKQKTSTVVKVTAGKIEVVRQGAVRLPAGIK